MAAAVDPVLRAAGQVLAVGASAHRAECPGRRRDSWEHVERALRDEPASKPDSAVPGHDSGARRPGPAIDPSTVPSDIGTVHVADHGDAIAPGGRDQARVSARLNPAAAGATSRAARAP